MAKTSVKSGMVVLARTARNNFSKKKNVGNGNAIKIQAHPGLIDSNAYGIIDGVMVISSKDTFMDRYGSLPIGELETIYDEPVSWEIYLVNEVFGAEAAYAAVRYLDDEVHIWIRENESRRQRDPG